MTIRNEPRRLWLGVISVILVLASVAACGGGSDEPDAATSATTTESATTATPAEVSTAETGTTETPVEGSLTIWEAIDDPKQAEWLTNFIEEFEEGHPGVTVELTPYSTEEYWTKLQAAFASGGEPDIFGTSGDEELMKYVRAGKVARLDDLIDVSLFNPAALDRLTWRDDGSVYGIPDATYLLGFIWYNKEIFAEHDVAIPETWDELLASCEELSAAGVIPIAFGDGGQSQWTATHWYDVLLYQYAGSEAALPASYGENGQSWSDPAFIEAATRLKDLVDANCFPPGFTGINYSQMSSLFIREEAAMIYTGSWFSGDLSAGGAEFQYGLFPLPDGPGAVNSTASLEGLVGGTGGFGISRRAADANPELVSVFANALGAAMDDYANQYGLISVAAEPKPVDDPIQNQLLTLFTSVEELAPVTDVTVGAALIDEYYQNIQALTAGSLTPEEFGEAMTEAAERERSNLPVLESSESP